MSSGRGSSSRSKLTALCGDPLTHSTPLPLEVLFEPIGVFPNEGLVASVIEAAGFHHKNKISLEGCGIGVEPIGELDTHGTKIYGLSDHGVIARGEIVHFVNRLEEWLKVWGLV
jgi:hypothetical protein